MPPTVAFTSGRPGRAQYLLKINPNFANFNQIKSQKINTASNEALELRGKNLASVLPPSVHPLTGYYFWLKGCRPDEIEVAQAPDWILDQMTVSIKERSQRGKPSGKTTLTARKTRSLPITATSSSTEIKKALLFLEVIHPKFADDYDSWIRIGMALKSVDPSLLSAWDTWSQLSSKYISGECEYKWQNFNNLRSKMGTLYHFASL